MRKHVIARTTSCISNSTEKQDMRPYSQSPITLATGGFNQMCGVRVSPVTEAHHQSSDRRAKDAVQSHKTWFTKLTWSLGPEMHDLARVRQVTTVETRKGNQWISLIVDDDDDGINNSSYFMCIYYISHILYMLSFNYLINSVIININDTVENLKNNISPSSTAPIKTEFLKIL